MTTWPTSSVSGQVGRSTARKREKIFSVASEAWCSMPSASASAASVGTSTARGKLTRAHAVGKFASCPRQEDAAVG